MDYSEANNIVHNVDLERVLLQKGVSAEHVAYLKEKHPHNCDEYYDYYEHISEKDEKNALIETKKIVGISRTNINASFYDNAAGRYKSELNVYRMAEAINHICDDTLGQLYAWYENLYDPVALVYFSDEDIYKVGRDGNHRALYANIIGAPLIKAEVAYYRLNEVKYKTFLYFKEVCCKYKLESVEPTIYGEPEFSFSYNTEEYVVTGYVNPKINGQYNTEQIDTLASQLNEDWRFIKKDRLISFLKKHSRVSNMILKAFCKDSKQAHRLNQHIWQRKIGKSNQ